MMRKVFSVALMAAVVGLFGGVAKDASAAVTIVLSWTACGGGTGGCTATGNPAGTILVDEITVNPGGGQTLRLDIFLENSEDMFAHGISLMFDTDLLNELNLSTPAPAEWAGTDVNPGPGVSTYGPTAPAASTAVQGTVESTGGVAGRVNWFESNAGGFAFSDNLPAVNSVYSVGSFTATAPARYRIGRVFFSVNTVTNDGDDVFSGLFAQGFDGVIGSDGSPVVVQNYLNASVNVVPEPGTVSLLGLGLVGLIVAGRRSRRS
jgi:hypothetical protein